jgi:hypothetical protein
MSPALARCSPTTGSACRDAPPPSTDRLYPESWFPFGNAVTTDPFSRRTGAILPGRSTDHLVIEINSATEYWQKGASLVHPDPINRNDADLPSNFRVYRITGTQHGGPRDLEKIGQPVLPHDACYAWEIASAAWID